MASPFNYKDISDKDLLLHLNKLRKVEDRQKLDKLPEPYALFSAEQRFNLWKRFQSEWQVHSHDKARFLEYDNQIILNKTEFQLHNLNKSYVSKNLKQITHLPYKSIPDQDKRYYFPVQPKTRDTSVFITDTDCTLITSIVTVASGLTTRLRATHAFNHFKPLVHAGFTPKKTSSPDFSYRPDSTKPFTVSEYTPIYPVLDLPILTMKPKPRSLFNSPIGRVRTNSPRASPLASPLVSPIGSRTTSPARPHTPPTSEHSTYSSPLNTPARKAPPYDPESPYLFKDMKARLEEVVLSPRKSPPKHPVESSSIQIPHKETGAIPKRIIIPSTSPNDDIDVVRLRTNILLRAQNNRLQQELDDLKARQIQQINTQLKSNEPILTPVVSPPINRPIPSNVPPIPPIIPPASPTQMIDKAKEAEINHLNKKINYLHGLFQKMQTKVDDSQLSEAERTALTKLAKPLPDSSAFIYALTRPANIIPEDQERDPKFLAILKGHAAIATLGTFDPEKNPKVDFRDIWDRILNYTKNHKLYEHEYIDLLMAVMKGSAASIINGIIREYGHSLEQVIEAIQDIYIPQHTIYDDVEDLNNFRRHPNENIRSTMRRASMIIERLKPTCTPAAWPDRKYHLMLSLIKQVVMMKTFKHLHSKEYESVQSGIQLEMKDILNIVSLYELTHELIPKQEIKIQYNISSLQLKNQPDTDHYSLGINSMVTRKPRLDKLRKTNSSLHFKPKHNPIQTSVSTPPSSMPQRTIVPPLDRLRKQWQSLPPNRVSSSNIRKASERAPTLKFNPKPNSFQNSQRRPDGTRDYRQSQTYMDISPTVTFDSNRPWTMNKRKYRDSRSQYPNKRQNSFNSFSNYRNSRSPSRSSYQYRSSTPTRYNNYRSSTPDRYNKSPGKFTRTFQKGNNKVTLTFYKCKVCTKSHIEGTPCNATSNF